MGERMVIDKKQLSGLEKILTKARKKKHVRKKDKKCRVCGVACSGIYCRVCYRCKNSRYEARYDIHRLD